jgi:MraZ protein
MLVGQFESKISEKGRTALPARFRKELGEKIIISRWYEKSLAIFSENSWEKILDLAVGGSLITESARDTERFLLGGAYEAELDAQGRLIVPAKLREYAELGKDAIFIGLKNRVEVWNKATWELREKEVEKHASQLIEQVQKSKWS